MSDDFDLPQVNKKKAWIPRKAESTEKIEAEAQVEKVEQIDQKVPQPEYSKEELLTIFDGIVFSGEYIEEILLRGRVPVKFSTRTAEQVNKIQDTLDASGYQLISSVEQRRTLLNLEQALVNYNGQDLGSMKVPERSKFVAQLPGPIIGMLIVELNKFDNKVAAACREESNF